MQRNHKDILGDHLRSFQNGEEKGFSFFFREYYAGLSYYAFTIIKNKEVAEEIAGDSLMKLWERSKNFKNIEAIRSFLYTTVRNASLNVMRDQHRKFTSVKELNYLSTITERNILEEIIETEVYKEIFLTIDTLPPRCKRIFKMLLFEKKDYQQIATELNLSISTIQNQKARALMLLKQRIVLPILVSWVLTSLI